MLDLNEIIYDTYVVCPLCNKEFKAISGGHLQLKHNMTMQEFKLNNGIPMGVALIAKDSLQVMKNNGNKRSEWFKKNVMPIGIDMSKKEDLVPKNIRVHSGKIRKGKSWITTFNEELEAKKLINLHKASELLNISYNYSRKCATDGRLKVIMIKGIRFTTKEWIEDARKLLQKNRETYRPDLLK